MNRGDAGHLLLNIKISGKPIWPSDRLPVPEGVVPVDELEISIGTDKNIVSKTWVPSGSQEIHWSESDDKFVVDLKQEDTFKLNVGPNHWQVRVRRGKDVLSSYLGTINIGPALSNKVLNN